MAAMMLLRRTLVVLLGPLCGYLLIHFTVNDLVGKHNEIGGAACGLLVAALILLYWLWLLVRWSDL